VAWLYGFGGLQRDPAVAAEWFARSELPEGMRAMALCVLSRALCSFHLWFDRAHFFNRARFFDVHASQINSCLAPHFFLLRAGAGTLSPTGGWLRLACGTAVPPAPALVRCFFFFFFFFLPLSFLCFVLRGVAR
jgi:hypothetical protein